jgi:hypothetical protein
MAGLQTNPPRDTAHPPAPSWVRYLLPSVSDLIFLILLLSICGSAFTPRLLGDAGIGWHIRNGEQMLRAHTITRTDPFSATMSGQAWYAWEWLYDLLIAGIHARMQLNGVVFFTALVIAATFALTFRLVLMRGGNAPVAVALLALAIRAAAIHLLARPHVLSWLLAVLWFHQLDAWETAVGPARNRRLFWLPALMLLWVNLHGGFLVGFILLGLYLTGGIIRYLAAAHPGRRQAAGHRLRHLGVIAGLSLLASLVNPYSYELHVHVYQYLSNRFLMDHIEEFRSPNFHGVAEQCFVALLLITIIALAVTREKPRVSRLLLVLFAAGSGLYASRNLPVSSLLLTLVVAPMVSRAMAGEGKDFELAGWFRQLLSRWDLFTARMGGMEASLHGHLWPVVAVAFGLWVCAHGGRLGSERLMAAHFDGTRFPVLATEYIAQSGMRDPVFCPDNWGGYLIYRLYPQINVVVDDRHDLYGEPFLKEYLKVVHVGPGWEGILRQKHWDVVLVPADSALATALKEKPGWSTLFQDDVAVLFERGKKPIP